MKTMVIKIKLIVFCFDDRIGSVSRVNWQIIQPLLLAISQTVTVTVNSRKRCEICSKLTIKIQERICERISHIFLVLSLLF